MKINYPVRFAAMPIVESVGWTCGLNELERKYDVVCYIVSKCYLISDLRKYTEDGREVREYEGVFPYQVTEFNKWKRILPSYNLIHGYCTNSNKIDMVFNSYDDALDYVNMKNKELFADSYNFLSFSDDFISQVQKNKDEFNKKLFNYKLLEKEILFYTQDMDICKKNELDNVIKIENNEVRVLSTNIYNVLELYDSDKFVIYTVSKEQLNKLVTLVGEDKINDLESTIGCVQNLLVHKSKDDLIKLAINVGSGAYYLGNNRICYDSNLNRVIKKDFENIDDNTIIFYTTETIEDILKSYRVSDYAEIDLRQIKERVLKRKK